MRKEVVAIAVAAALSITPMLAACGGSNGANTTPTQGSQVEQQAPVLDGKWRQVGHGEGEDGMIGTVDGDMIALWISGDGNQYTYWCGTFEAPKDSKAYTFTSKADKANMTGLLASQDDSKEFSYENGKITFKFSMRGETTDVVMEQVSEEGGLLTDLKSREGKQASEDADIKELVLADSNYVLSNGYVQYVLAINNPNTDYAPDSVNVSVVGRAADGTISFSDDWVIGTTLPGATTYWASQAGNGNVSESDTVEIKISVDKDEWLTTSMKDGFYKIENVSTSKAQYGGMSASGEITLTEDVELPGHRGAKKPMLVCVLKNADGKLVAGYSTFVNSDLKVGEPSAFEIKSMSDAVEFSTAEVYANPWM
jgi:hypothetical protein